MLVVQPLYENEGASRVDTVTVLGLFVKWALLPYALHGANNVIQVGTMY